MANRARLNCVCCVENARFPTEPRSPPYNLHCCVRKAEEELQGLEGKWRRVNQGQVDSVGSRVSKRSGHSDPVAVLSNRLGLTALQACVLPIHPILASTCPVFHLPRPRFLRVTENPRCLQGCVLFYILPGTHSWTLAPFDAALLSVSLWLISTFSAHQFLFLSRIWSGT